VDLKCSSTQAQIRPIYRAQILPQGPERLPHISRIEVVACAHAYALIGMFALSIESRPEAATIINSASSFVFPAKPLVLAHTSLWSQERPCSLVGRGCRYPGTSG
jgi:hypothetical protein